jgi:hypothetical protein
MANGPFAVVNGEWSMGKLPWRALAAIPDLGHCCGGSCIVCSRATASESGIGGHSVRLSRLLWGDRSCDSDRVQHWLLWRTLGLLSHVALAAVASAAVALRLPSHLGSCRRPRPCHSRQCCAGRRGYTAAVAATRLLSRLGSLEPVGTPDSGDSDDLWE